MSFSLDLAKAVGILLITNSHLENFYPLPVLATGGMLGNCLFFFASGLGIALGLARSDASFVNWYLKRIRRIYIPLWIFQVIMIAFGFEKIHHIKDMFFAFIVPHEYWFLPAIAVFYAPAFWVIKFLNSVQARALMASFLVLFVALGLTMADLTQWDVENHIPIKSMFYFSIMLLGISSAKSRPPTNVGKREVAGFAICTCCFFIFLLLMVKYDLFRLQMLANFIAAAWCFLFFRAAQHRPLNSFLEVKFGTIINALSLVTLQIYIVQVPLLELDAISSLLFPINIIIFLAVLTILSFILYKITAVITEGANRILGLRQRTSG